MRWEQGGRGEKGLCKGTKAGVSREAGPSHSGRIRCEVAEVRGLGQGSAPQIINETERRGTSSGEPRGLNFNMQPGANL